MPKGIISRRQVGLPARPFLYTPDQIGHILAIPTKLVRDAYLYYVGRTPTVHGPNQMVARNIAPDPSMEPIWRVSEQELIRWMQYKGFKFYERVVLYSDAPEWGSESISNERKRLMPDSPGDPVDPEEQEG